MRDRIWIHHIGQNTCLLGEGTQEPYCLLHCFFPFIGVFSSQYSTPYRLKH